LDQWHRLPLMVQLVLLLQLFQLVLVDLIIQLPLKDHVDPECLCLPGNLLDRVVPFVLQFH